MSGVGDSVSVGQVWASSHKGDVDYLVRQRRTVVAVDETHATVSDGGSKRPRLKLNKAGTRIVGHCLVAPAASVGGPDQ